MGEKIQRRTYSPFASMRHGHRGCNGAREFATAKMSAGSAKISDSGATVPIEPESERWASLMRVTHVSRSHSTESSRFCCYCRVLVQATGTVGSLWVQLLNVKVFTSDWLPDVDTLTVA